MTIHEQIETGDSDKKGFYVVLMLSKEEIVEAYNKYIVLEPEVHIDGDHDWPYLARKIGNTAWNLMSEIF